MFLSSYRVSSFSRHSLRIWRTRGSIEWAFNSSLIFERKFSWGFVFCCCISAKTSLLGANSPSIFAILFVELSFTVSSVWWFSSVTSETKSATSSSDSSSFALHDSIRDIANPILLARPPPCVVVDLFWDVLSSLMFTLEIFKVDSSFLG